MEKFSAYRDPGTGIQPFLTPLPPLGSNALANALLPFGYVLAAIRTVLLIAATLLYVVVVRGICLVFIPVPILYRTIAHALTALIARIVLLLSGLYWIPVQVVSRKRGRGAQNNEPWSPKAGDIIVSNWVSWIELLWLAIKCNPIFVLPVAEPQDVTSETHSPITHTPGRRTGTGSANISSVRAPIIRAPILGFHEVSLLQMIRLTGCAPPFPGAAPPRSLDDIRLRAKRPVVVFPECTTSNGRGLLRFADVFGAARLPVKGYKVFVMCVRYDSPTNLAPTLARPIPSHVLNPLGHFLKLATTLAPLPISIRLLAPSDSPSSGSFMLSEVLSGSSMGAVTDELSEACAALIAQIGKLKRTGMGWEDKRAFLKFFWSQRR
ncbi:hypothetical protein PLICRDRAFT_33557 [Plicaturopsis crispa FD-325 SS-3]|nr:hypothetical protein PLICRDRAFT_33557 [Plicaturopsis crispa FD-325 SS-3]